MPHSKMKCPKFRKRRFGFIRRLWVDFGRLTTLHGISYITRNNYHWIETLMWTIVVLLANLSAISLISRSWARYDHNPIVISIEKDYRNWEVDFPAVTGCFIEKMNLTSAHKFIIEEMKVEPNATEYEDYVRFLSAVTNLSYDNVVIFKRLARDGRFNNFTGLELKEIANKLLNRMEYFSANELKMDFVKVVTEVGLCYTYAGNVSHFMSPKFEVNHLDVMTCNFETPLCGIRLEEFTAPIAFYVHSPYEIPELGSNSLMVDQEMELDVSFKFFEMISAPEIRKLSVRRRRCRFSDEPLSGDKFYSYNFCRMKCRMKMMLDLCGCVPLFYPHDDGVNVCDVEGLACVAEQRNKIVELLRENPSECICYANCDSIEYNLDRIRRTAWKFPAPVNIIFSWSIDNFSKTRTKRSIIFRVEDLLVSFGGIAALFLGCSVISFVEMVNFFALQWIWKILK